MTSCLFPRQLRGQQEPEKRGSWVPKLLPPPPQSPGSLLTSASPGASAPPPTFLSGMPNVKCCSLWETVTVVTGVILHTLSQVTEGSGTGGLLPEASVDSPSSTHASPLRAQSSLTGHQANLSTQVLSHRLVCSRRLPHAPKGEFQRLIEDLYSFQEILKANRLRRLLYGVGWNQCELCGDNISSLPFLFNGSHWIKDLTYVFSLISQENSMQDAHFTDETIKAYAGKYFGWNHKWWRECRAPSNSQPLTLFPA